MILLLHFLQAKLWVSYNSSHRTLNDLFPSHLLCLLQKFSILHAEWSFKCKFTKLFPWLKLYKGFLFLLRKEGNNSKWPQAMCCGPCLCLHCSFISFTGLTGNSFSVPWNCHLIACFVYLNSFLSSQCHLLYLPPPNCNLKF